jgi:hypothetical protein
MRLQSDIVALAAIEEDARMMLKWIRLPEDHKNWISSFVCCRSSIWRHIQTRLAIIQNRSRDRALLG